MRYSSRNLGKKRVLWKIYCGERSLKTLDTVGGVEGLNIDWEMLSVNQTPINYKRHNRRADRRGAVIVVFDLAYLSPGRHCRPLPNWIQPPPHRPRHSSLYGRLTKTNLSIKLCMVFWPLFTPQFVGSPDSVLLPTPEIYTQRFIDTFYNWILTISFRRYCDVYTRFKVRPIILYKVQLPVLLLLIFIIVNVMNYFTWLGFVA